MTIPKEVKTVIEGLEKAGFEAYIVGGCVRDLLLDNTPKDWDVTTNAKPEEIQKVFPDSFYENKFLTVTVKTGSDKISEVEVTTYRLETTYSDKRHPDGLDFADSLEDDLARRDFTVNAMAMDKKGKLVDLFEGQKDLKKKIIRTVGQAEKRFSEDALRMLRGVRFATTLDFSIEEQTSEAIKKNSRWLEAVSQERIRDELIKMIMSPRAAAGIELLRELGLLKYVIPELLENYGVAQNKHHIYDCYTHALKALEFAAKKKFNVHTRLASLLHDIAKPRTKGGEGANATFYNHQMVGAKMAFQILNRLKFPKKDIEKIVTLVRYHMFYYNAGEVTDASVRRLVKNVGPENMDDLLNLRQADRIGSGVPKAEPYKLRHLKYLIEKVSKDPISAKMLKVDGKDVMDILGIAPGPKIGYILTILLGYVLEDPEKNEAAFLEGEIKKLGELSDADLQSLSKKSGEQVDSIEEEQDKETKHKYYV